MKLIGEDQVHTLEVTELESVRGDRMLFAGICFSLESGELLHVRGANGSGKTTLLRMICGLVQPVRGEIRWGGRRVQPWDEEYLENITYIGHSNAIKDGLTCRENLLFSSILSGANASDAEVSEALDKMGLPGYDTFPTKLLSQGQKRRTALARLLLAKTPLWILDEPLNALDVQAVQTIESALEQHLARGGMVLLTSHQEVSLGVSDTKELHLSYRAATTC